MTSYYLYLLRTTWPYIVVLFFLWFFILVRIIGKTQKTLREERDAWGFIVLGTKILILISVLVFYSWELLQPQLDWFYAPGIIRGEVIKKENGKKDYLLQIQGESQEKRLSADRNTFEKLTVGTQVEVVYLVHRGEIVQCKIINKERGKIEK